MPPLKKKKTVKYSPECLELALKEIRCNGKKIRETCRKFGVPRTTIQDRLCGKRPDDIKSRGPEPTLGTAGEASVVQWLVNIARCGFPIKKVEILDAVQRIIKDQKIANPFKNDRPGQTWYMSFLARNPIVSIMTSEAVMKVRAGVTENYIRAWFRELQTFLSEEGHSDILKHPDRIFNAGEIDLSFCQKTGKVLGPKGCRKLPQVKLDKDNLTVFLVTNATGQIGPPLVTFPYLNPPDAVVDSMPPDWCLGKSESGRMKSDIFFEYVTDAYNAWVEDNNIQKPVLILVDGCKTHMTLELSATCEQLDIILYSLPPKTTDTLHPADISILAHVKTNWKKIVRFFLTRPDLTDKSVTQTNFCQLMKDIIESPQMETAIIDGFRSCGLYPFDPNAVDYTKCVKITSPEPEPEENISPPKQGRINIKSPKESRPNITKQDLISTRKVIHHLCPILKEKKVDYKLILKEVEKLGQSDQCEILHARGFEVCPVLRETENE